MKRLIIFAAMLLTMNVLNAETVREDPPPVKPEAEQVILILKDVHDIDRSIPYCGFTWHENEGYISVTCHGTGNPTELALVDNRGNIVDLQITDPYFNPQVVLEVPDAPGVYTIVLNSVSYYGEGCVTVY